MAILRKKGADSTNADALAALERRAGELAAMRAAVDAEIEQLRRDLVEARQRQHDAAVLALVGDEEVNAPDYASRIRELTQQIADAEMRQRAIVAAIEEVQRRGDAVRDEARRVAREAAAGDARRVASELRVAIARVVALNQELAKHAGSARGVPDVPQAVDYSVLNLIRDGFSRALGPAA